MKSRVRVGEVCALSAALLTFGSGCGNHMYGFLEATEPIFAKQTGDTVDAKQLKPATGKQAPSGRPASPGGTRRGADCSPQDRPDPDADTCRSGPAQAPAGAHPAEDREASQE